MGTPGSACARSLMRLSVIPSAKWSRLGSPLRFANGRTTMDGVHALRRSSEDTTSLATAPRSLTDGVEDDHSSHHAAGAVNKTRATAPTATSEFRVIRRPFDAAAFVGSAAAAPASACNIDR